MDNIIVPDVRMKPEIEFFKKQGAFLIRVESTFENRSKRGLIVNPDDITETNLDDFKEWNILIENDSTYEDLVFKSEYVIEVLNNFFIEKADC